jgi:hypothetical protein
MAFPRIFAVLSLPALLIGCDGPGQAATGPAANGITYYLDGAGNWGFGVADVPAGLSSAGYKGKVENILWTSSFNPAIDQVNPINHALQSGTLAGRINDYHKKNPTKNINIISLSAGTGIAVWAAEKVKPPAKINNMILLGSSLSARYNMSKALANMKGKIYVYYSNFDEVLEGPVKAIGTVDHQVGVDAVGLVGSQSPRGRERIVNIGWSSRYKKYGWSGAHTDCTSKAFVAGVLARHVVDQPSSTDPPEIPSTRAAIEIPLGPIGN